MGIYIGQSNKDQAAIRIGSTNIGKVYVGEKLVWPNQIVFSPVRYGGIYNFYAGIDQIAPIGWHMPNDVELDLLATNLGGANVAGGKLKETGSNNWGYGNLATNEALFFARGAGYRVSTNGSYAGELSYMYLFSSTQRDSTLCWAYEFFFNSVAMTKSSYVKKSGASIRLLKDDSNDPGFMRDNSGYIYPTVKIANQVWTACNIKTEHFRDGRSIPLVLDNSEWINLITPGRCYPMATISKV